MVARRHGAGEVYTRPDTQAPRRLIAYHERTVDVRGQTSIGSCNLSSRAESLGVAGAAARRRTCPGGPGRTDRTAGLLANVTVETLAWATLVVLAALTGFWELGDKALHHDESLHAYYSWIWAAGGRLHARSSDARAVALSSQRARLLPVR